MAQSQRGKTIELFLENGTMEGKITATLYNWDGAAVKVPRGMVANYEKNDIQQSGVYFLFSIDDNGTESVYIGASDNVLGRLRQHLRSHERNTDIDLWTTAVVFTGGILGRDCTASLEDRLVQTARQCGRSRVLTKKTSPSPLRESRVAAVETFIDNAKMLLRALGHKTLVPAPQPGITDAILVCRGNNADARGFLSDDGFTVLEGSRVSDHTPPSFERHESACYELRTWLEANGTIAGDVFQSSFEFSSPSAASAVVLGRTSSGNKDWKTESGITLGELRQSQSDRQK